MNMRAGDHVKVWTEGTKTLMRIEGPDGYQEITLLSDSAVPGLGINCEFKVKDYNEPRHSFGFRRTEV